MNTPVASPDLLPCPFCGGEAAMHNYPADEDTTWWFAQCGDCGARNGEQLAADAPDQEFAIEAWNRRALASPAPSAGVVDAAMVERAIDAWHKSGKAFKTTSHDWMRAALIAALLHPAAPSVENECNRDCDCVGTCKMQGDQP